MSGSRLQAALRIFQEVCDLRGAEQSRALSSACGSDAALRRQVEDMLRRDAQPTDVLQVDALAGAPARLAEALEGSGSAADAEVAGQQIGPYRLIRKIGEGGMGTVYEARQQSPKRTVAIKVLRPSGNWASLQKRFEHEAFILGRLQHPGIAQIIEAGRQPGPGGEQLYLVMELVRGRDLIKYAESRSLDARQRIELFIRVCEAVQHAHQKAVIHRDLKPPNILVVDDESFVHTLQSTAIRVPGQPKILDFGVARLTDSDLHVTTVATGVGQLIGTLPYMSPEQVVGDPDEIDTRADVYSLGVVLHELLTGRLPYDLRNRSMLEAARIIREAPPQKLSTIDRALRGDLETIVGKALEKDKTRRYQSAAELASDLRAFLEGAPIAARRDSRWYVVQKSLRRYKLVAGLAAVLFLVSAGSATAFGVLYQREQRASRIAEIARRNAADAEAAARRQAQQAAAVNHFLQDVLHAADSRAVGREAKISDALAYAESRVEGEFGDALTAKAAIYYALSQTYEDMGLAADAERNVNRALRLQRTLTPDGSVELADMLINYGAFLGSQRRFEEAVAALSEAEALAQRFAPDDVAKRAWVRSNLGTVYAQMGNLAEAEPRQREAVRLRETLAAAGVPRCETELAESLHLLAGTLYAQRRLDEAVALAERAIAIFEKNITEAPSRQFPMCLHALAQFELERGNEGRARELFHRALAVIESTRGPDHLETMNAVLGVAQFERLHGDAARAEALYRRALDVRKRTYPAGHPELGQPLTGLGATLVKLNRAAEAEPLLREAYESRKAAMPDAYVTSVSAANLGECLFALKKYDEAEPLLREGFDGYLAARGIAAAATCRAAELLRALYAQIGATDKLAAFDAETAPPPPASAPPPDAAP